MKATLKKYTPLQDNTNVRSQWDQKSVGFYISLSDTIDNAALSRPCPMVRAIGQGTGALNAQT